MRSAGIELRLQRLVAGLGIAVLLGGPAGALTFTVDSTGDGSDTSAGDGVCVATSGGCTLRAAMEEANAHPDADIIAFDIAGSGVHTIDVVGGSEGGNDLPFIVAPLTIDGFTQHDSQPNTNATGGLNAVPLIEFDGSGSFHCLTVFNSFNPGPTTIRGLVMNGCHSEAVDLEAGTTTFIEGNFIGTDATGTTAKGLANGIDMFVQSSGLTFTVGGTTPDKRNLISGVAGGAIGVQANLDSSIVATIQGNLIGTDKTGMLPVPNRDGIASFGAGTDTLLLTIGGSATGAGNVISGNTRIAVDLGHFSSNSVVQGNLIGTAVDGVSPLGNGGSGIKADDAPLTIGGTAPGEGNVIAYNGSGANDPGVYVSNGKPGTRIVGNSIFANVALGIDLDPIGPNQNDDGDGDGGANDRQNFPALAAGVFPGGTTVDGTLDSTPGTTFRIEVFANDACDPSGNGEGQAFVGANDAVTTDGTGHASFTVTFAPSLPSGTILTATATAPDGSTSEFGPCTDSPPTTTTSTTTSTTSTTTSSSTSSTSSTSTTAVVPTTSTTSSSSTSSSTSRTTTTAAATTTTLVVTPCAAVPVGPTFASILCRLAALRDATEAATALADLRPKLDQPLGKAIARTTAARDFCADSDAKRARSRLKQVRRQCIQYSHRLRGLKARKTASAEVRDPLSSEGDAIGADARTLRDALSCPADAGG